MTARMAQVPPAEYRPKGSSDCMVECLECSIEWGWGASPEKCEAMAAEHNTRVHGGA